MTASLEYFLSTTGEAFGFRADGNRLAQRWAWFSLADEVCPTGNLVDIWTGALTSLGVAYRDDVAALP